MGYTVRYGKKKKKKKKKKNINNIIISDRIQKARHYHARKTRAVRPRTSRTESSADGTGGVDRLDI